MTNQLNLVSHCCYAGPGSYDGHKPFYNPYIDLMFIPASNVEWSKREAICHENGHRILASSDWNRLMRDLVRKCHTLIICDLFSGRSRERQAEFERLTQELEHLKRMSDPIHEAFSLFCLAHPVMRHLSPKKLRPRASSAELRLSLLCTYGSNTACLYDDLEKFNKAAIEAFQDLTEAPEIAASMVLLLSYMSLAGWATMAAGSLQESHDPNRCMYELLDRALASLKTPDSSDWIAEAYNPIANGRIRTKHVDVWAFWRSIEPKCFGNDRELSQPPGWLDHRWDNTTRWSNKSGSEKDEWEDAVKVLTFSIEGMLQSSYSPSWLEGRDGDLFGPHESLIKTSCFWLDEEIDANGKSILLWNDRYSHALIHRSGHQPIQDVVLNSAAERLLVVESLRCDLSRRVLAWEGIQEEAEQLRKSFEIVQFAADKGYRRMKL